MSGLARLRQTLAIGGAGLVIMTGACGAPAPRTDQSLTPPVVPTVAGTSLSSPAATKATPSQPPAEPPRTDVTVVMNGDLLWHNTLWYGAREDARRRGKRGYDFAPLLARLRPVVAGADLAICHQEVPIGRSDRPYRNFPRFAVPRQVVNAIKDTGYDVCTTASNHSVDRGFAGVKRTLDELDRVGIAHAGTARTPREANRPTILTTKQGVKIAVISGTFSLNGLPMPRGKPWAVNGLAPGDVREQARNARKAGADLVLVAAHAGTEYSTRENAQQRKLAHSLTSAGDVDLVYMHHAHVVQPWVKINGRWVVYGLGNAVGQGSPNRPRTYEGVTARFTFSRSGSGRFAVSKAEYIPTFVTRYRPGRPARVHVVSASLPDADGQFRRRLLVARARTTAVVNRHDPTGLRRS